MRSQDRFRWPSLAPCIGSPLPPTMRLGILGVGRIGAYHARVAHALPGVTALAVRDVRPERAERVRAELATPTRPVVLAHSTDALLAQVDGVLIATPTATHAALLEAAMRAGVPAFCEKPVALDLATVRTLAALEAERGAVVQVGFQRRFDAGYRAARDLVQSGALGTVYSVRIAGHDPAPPAEDYLPLSGGIFRDLHIHDFDIVPWVLGQPIEEVYMQGAVRADPMFARHDDVDTVAGTLRFADGTLGVLTGGRHDPLGYDIRLEVFGARDSIAVGWDARTPLRSVEAGMPPAPPDAWPGFLARFDAAYHAELAHFADVVAGRATSACPIADTEHALCVALAGERSRRERRPVAVAEIAP
jgi:myo-inositol 2-dehydrogenase/D-chiro-inositol 1-dehydrogenase